MATPRKRHFRVADAILREPWPREQKLTLVLLMAYLNARWRRDGIPNSEAGHAPISPGTLCDITGKSGVKWGVVALRKLSEIVSISVETRDEIVWVDWPKFADFQSFDTRKRGKAGARKTPETAPADAPSDSDSDSGSEQEKKEQEKTPHTEDRVAPPPPAGSARPRKSVSRKTDAPEALEPEAQAHVLDWCLTQLGPVRGAPKIAGALIEKHLRKMRADGRRYVRFDEAVISWIASDENAERKRDGDPPLPPIAEARKIRAFAEEGRRRNAEFAAEEAARRENEPEFSLPMRQVSPGLKVAQ